jgi:SAM-dependent methyltransferase
LSEIYEVNRAGWDERAAIHLRDVGGFYNVAGFRAGADTLLPIEANEIGDVNGLRIAHLQCHIGLDTLSLVRRGAEVVGLDFSSVAIAAARQLGHEAGLCATFVEANVYDARTALTGLFDLVYVTWGAINWLPDIARWGRIVGSLLRPGGRLYMADTHPFAFCLAETRQGYRVYDTWRSAPDKPIVYDTDTTYTGDPVPLVHRRYYEWAHPISSILGAIREGGLQLERFNEHETLTYKLFPSLIADGPQSYRLPANVPAFPLSFSLWATKKSENPPASS